MKKPSQNNSEKPIEYYVLLYDDARDDLEAVDDYEMGDFDLTVFWSGTVFEGDIPDEIEVLLTEGTRSDLLGNPMSWLIISKKMQAILHPLCGETVQFVPLTVWKKKKPVKDYVIANPLGSIGARASKHETIQNMKLITSKISRHRHLFRLRGDTTTFVISAAVFEALRGKGLKGLAARKVELV